MDMGKGGEVCMDMGKGERSLWTWVRGRGLYGHG